MSVHDPAITAILRHWQSGGQFKLHCGWRVLSLMVHSILTSRYKPEKQPNCDSQSDSFGLNSVLLLSIFKFG